MSVRSVRGLLLTLLAVCAAVALSLAATPSASSPKWVESFSDVSSLLYGWRLAAATLAVGLSVWLGGVVIEAVASARVARWAAVLMMLASPGIAVAAVEAYWASGQRMGVWRVDGGSPNQREGVWRGLLSGSCGWGSVVELRLGADGRGRGRAVPMHLTGYSTAAILVASPLTGRLAVPVQAVMHDGKVRVWSAAESLGTATVVSP